jgi:hypothetical protein
MEGTSSAVFQVKPFARFPEGGSKTHQALAPGERGRVIKANNRMAARKNHSRFFRASLCDKRCPGTSRLG